MDKEKPDLGRHDVTKKDADKGAFKTPTLRNLLQTGPYMHDGSEETLLQVVEFYDRGGVKNPTLSADIKPLNVATWRVPARLRAVPSSSATATASSPPRRLGASDRRASEFTMVTSMKA
jgi:cytochrome c peroxidase